MQKLAQAGGVVPGHNEVNPQLEGFRPIAGGQIGPDQDHDAAPPQTGG